MLPDGSYHLAVGSTEMGNGSVTSHRQIAASVLGARADSIAIINADTDLTPYDTGTFASTGTVVAGQAVALTAAALRDNILDFASRAYRRRRAPTAGSMTGRSICGKQQIALADLHAAGTEAGHRFEAKRKAYLSPRTVAFNVHGVRLAVHRVTGEIRILHSVHAADIGRLINPMQCRGQIDGAIGMGFGWALTENMVYDDDGNMVNPQLAQLPHPGLRRRAAQRGLFRRYLRHDRPARGEGAGRVRDQSRLPRPSPTRWPNATGVRFAHLPFTPDRIFDKLAGSRERNGEPTGTRRALPDGAQGAVTIVTQTRVRPESTDAFARWQDGDQRHGRAVSRASSNRP